MISIQKSELCEMIRESYIRSLNESKNFDREIVSNILALKDMLRKRNFVCTTQYTAPDPSKKHRDYGYCSIKVDTTVGRGKSMRPQTISRLVARLCGTSGLNKYFSMVEHGYDGKYCDCGMNLKPKYVQKYMGPQQLQ